jgi:protein O-mannosyl-transferase
MASKRKKDSSRKSFTEPVRTKQESLFTGWFPYILITAFCFLLYGQTLSFAYTFLDDNALIMGDFNFIKNLSNLARSFQRDVFNNNSPSYRPALTLSFMVDAQIGEASPWVFHFSNIIFHVLASCSVFLFLKRLRYTEKMAFLFGLLFVSHPILSQAVAWIPGRNDSMLTVFTLLSFVSFIKFIEKNRWDHFLLHIILFSFALFTKETAIIFPLLCLLYLQLVVGEGLLTKRKFILGAGWFTVMLFWFLLRRSALAHAAKVSYGLDSFLYNSRAFIEFIGAIFFPFHLSVYPTFNTISTIIGLVALIALLVILFLTRLRRKNYVLFGACWFILLLLPTFAVRQESVDFDYLNHRVYLPIVGIIIILLEILTSREITIESRRATAIAATVIVLFSLITVVHSSNFKDGIKFWTNASVTSPRAADARYNLGYVYYLNHQLDKTEENYKAAIDLQPENHFLSPKYHLNLGLIYEERGQINEAGEKYRKAISLDPKFALAYCNLGTIYSKQGRLKDSEENYKQAILLDPKLGLAHYNLCSIYYQQGRFDEAEGHCKRAIEIDGDLNRAYFGLISIYYSTERYEEAIRLVDELEKRGIDVEKEIPDVVKALDQHR